MKRREFLRASAGGLLALYSGGKCLDVFRLEISHRVIRLGGGRSGAS